MIEKLVLDETNYGKDTLACWLPKVSELNAKRIKDKINEIIDEINCNWCGEAHRGGPENCKGEK